MESYGERREHQFKLRDVDLMGIGDWGLGIGPTL